MGGYMIMECVSTVGKAIEKEVWLFIWETSSCSVLKETFMLSLRENYQHIPLQFRVFK